MQQNSSTKQTSCAADFQLSHKTPVCVGILGKSGRCRGTVRRMFATIGAWIQRKKPVAGRHRRRVSLRTKRGAGVTVADANSPVLLSGLDARQRAMLQEMGVRVWWPQVPSEQAHAHDRLADVPKAESAPDASIVAPQDLPAPETALARPRKPPVDVSGEGVPHAQPAIGQGAATRDASAEQVLPAVDPAWDLTGLRTAAVSCQACRLCAGRRHIVWEAVLPELPQGLPRWLFVLDAPGHEENATGLPAQGDAGQLLGNMAAAIRLLPAQVYRAHATKCAPAPGYRVGTAELGSCAAWLRQEMLRVQPQLVVCMGRHAAYSVLGSTAPLGQLRGQPHRLALSSEEGSSWGALADVPVVVTYAPTYLMRNPAVKRQAWQDLCLASSLVVPGR